MSMASLFCRIFAQNAWPDLIWISARISETEETSLDTHNLQGVYIVKKIWAYWRWAGVQDRLAVFRTSIS